ncbi:MAG TPA: HlyD family efflux transporter periplasmic adaptor subunit [Allosphingosinicella sp.]|nr:HlyD family efflux transporter periplasmic adaptor subunit [Allosphingosinicella sp.]
MATQLFRQEVIEAGRDRLAGTVVAAVPPRSRLYTLIILGFAAIIVAILIFGQYASSARVRGIIAYDAGIARVYPASPAEVRIIHVRTGQRVSAGDPLVTVSLAQGSNGVTAQLAQIDRQDAELARQQGLAGQIGATEAGGLTEQRAGLRAAIASLERQRSIAAGQINLAQSATRRATELASEGAGTQRQVEDARATLLARRAEHEGLTERLIAQREQLRAIDNQVAGRTLEASRNDAVLGAQRAALAEQREALLRTHQLTLTAPIDGEVGDVAVEVGQRARPDASLVTIVPAGSNLEVWLYANSRAVGFVRPGQEVRLLFDSFPYQTYGAGRGRVTQVSRVPTEPSAIDAQLGIEEPVFRIRVAIESLAPRASADQRRLRPGMTLSANLVLERRNLWQVLFNPFLATVAR